MSKEEKTYFIYVRSTGEKVPVTKAQHDSFYKEADRIRHKEQNHGRCMCPYRFIWKCDGDCIGCEYHAAGDTTSLDQPLPDGNGTLGDYIPDRSKPMEEVIADRMLLEQLFARLRELDPEADTIIQLWKDHPEGISDRAIARELGRPATKSRSLREKSGRKPGGQVGHKGNGLAGIAVDETVVTDHYPGECMDCPHREECLNRMKCIAAGHVYETRTIVVDNTHKEYGIVCPMARKLYKASLEEADVASYQQYGNSIKSAILVLWSVGISSIKRIGRMMRNLFRISLSEGTIQNIIDGFADRCDKGVEVIKSYLSKAKVKGADETGLRTDGSLHWLHVVCNDKATYLYANKKRGFRAMEDDGLLLDASGSLIHDCWSSYFKLESVSHAICLQHIQRELRGAALKEPKHKEYFKSVEDLLLEMRKAKLDAMERGMTSLNKSKTASFKKIYRHLITKGLETFKQPKRKSRLRLGKIPQGKVRSLLLAPALNNH